MNSIYSPNASGSKLAYEKYLQKNVTTFLTFLFLFKLSPLIAKTSGACN